MLAPHTYVTFAAGRHTVLTDSHHDVAGLRIAYAIPLSRAVGLLFKVVNGELVWL